MLSLGPNYSGSASGDSSIVSYSGGGGVCMMRNIWRDEQHPSLINFISSFLRENSFRLNFVPIAPDFIFNCGGLSVAFVFVTDWDCDSTSLIFSRTCMCFWVPVRYGMQIGKPTFVPVQDLAMGFEKIVKIAHARGVCKQYDAISKLKTEREQSVQRMDAFLRVATSIPQIDNHDANALNQAVGSIEAIARASKDQILEKTDLSAEKAETITMFFRDPIYYLSPRISS